MAGCSAAPAADAAPAPQSHRGDETLTDIARSYNVPDAARSARLANWCA
jgi:hypothetical protein